MTKARDVMTPNPEWISPDVTLEDVAKKLADGDFGALPICTEKKRLEGMITDRDIVVYAIAKGKDPKTTTVRDIWNPTEVVTIGADDSAEEALETMERYQVRRLPVIDGHDLVGMVAQADLAKTHDERRVGEAVENISQ